MNIDDIKYKTSYTSSLNVGSTMTEQDLMFYTEGQTSINFPFGQSDKDVLKLSVFNLDGGMVSSSVIYSTGKYIDYTHSFYNVLNKYSTYSYSSFSSDWAILQAETQSLFLDLAKEFNKMGMTDGNYTAIIELNRNTVGSNMSSDDKLIIDQISPSRTEISVIPKSLAGTDSEIGAEYTIYRNNQLQIKEVVEEIVSKLSSPEIYTAYYAATSQDPTGSAYFKHYYGFTHRENEIKNDIDAISFITDMYYGVRKGNLRNSGDIATNDILGVYDQYKNWLYQNYEVGALFQDLRDYYYSLFKFIVDQELNRITNQLPKEYDNIVNFLQRIYYNIIFFPIIYMIEYKYNIDISGYFKHYINLDSGASISIVNKRSESTTDPRYWDKLYLKLSEGLPPNISVGDELWISNTFGFLPIVQNVYYFTKPYIRTIPLRGPNFLVKIENQGNSTEALSMEQLINQTGSAYNDLVTKLTAPIDGIIDNTNYRKFENFINFSSANLRLAAFDTKNERIAELNKTSEDLSAYIQENPVQRTDPANIPIFFTSSQAANNYNFVDKYHYEQLDEISQEITSIESGMDGYEKFLYNNPAWYNQHVSSASLYDQENRNSLINNLPQFLVEDAEQNKDYIMFVGMIGHFFDNMSLLIKQLTEKNNYSNSPSYGISVDIVEDMLASLGWEAEISKENLPILLSSFNHNDFDFGTDMYDKSRPMSEEQRNQIIWKRILNSLPYIYKTKGTEASLSALLGCFGVPKNIIKIKEYGGIQNVHSLQDESLYILDEVKYEPYFSGSGEYFKLNWTGSAQTVEFNFAFDPDSTSEYGQVFRLANCPDHWAVGVYREKGKVWGRMFFSLDDGTGNVKTIMTDKAPIFDGSTYHAMIRRNDPSDGFAAYGYSSSLQDQFPVKYDLYLQRAEDSRITFFTTSSIHLSGSYNTEFRSGSYLYVGNYNQNTASLNLDPEAFFGNIDEIKVWEYALTDTRFENHTLHQSSYDLDSPNTMVMSNLYRISFERPLDLHDSSPVVLKNLSFRADFPTFEAVNFPISYTKVEKVTNCGPTTVSIFPWQFTRKDTRQTIKLPDYGSGKFKSNKINYVEQEMISNLSATERSTKKSSDLISSDSNRLGIFFSPAEIQNSEIIKFFGEYPLSELVGDPSDVYRSSYVKFEKFRQIFYDQGFGNIDYQFFMNVVRFYFDKAMFKYIRSTIPARAKLVDGILVEPTILERPKIQLKLIKQETIPQTEGHVVIPTNVNGYNLQALTQSLALRNTGRNILNDVNHVFFPTDQDQYGFSIYSDNGVTYYNGEYYRADIIKVKKQYQIPNKYNLPANTNYNALVDGSGKHVTKNPLVETASAWLNDEQIYRDLNGTVQTVSSSYYKINLAKLPTLYEYKDVISIYTASFSGSINIDVGFVGSTSPYLDFTSSHTIDGLLQTCTLGGAGGSSYIYSPGINVRATYLSTQPIQYNGYFGPYDPSTGTCVFSGSIFGYTQGQVGATKFSASFYTDPVEGSSIFDIIRYRTYGPFFGPLAAGINYRKAYSMEYYPNNAALLNGYFIDHYKFTRKQFSLVEINSYDLENAPLKWKKNSQNKKTTIDPKTGLLDNSDPVETKTV
jgi:hypothetical protein